MLSYREKNFRRKVRNSEPLWLRKQYRNMRACYGYVDNSDDNYDKVREHKVCE